MRHLEWHADLPAALATDDNLSEPDFKLLADECTAFSVSAWSAGHEGAAMHTERQLTGGGTKTEWADLKRGNSPAKDVMP